MVLWIGVDASLLHTGVVILHPVKEPRCIVVDRDISSVDVLGYMGYIKELYPEATKLVVLIEKNGSAAIPRFRDHVREAQKWGKAFKDAFKRAAKVTYIPSVTWRKALFGTPWPKDPKGVAKKFTDENFPTLSGIAEDVDEAACLACVAKMGWEATNG